MQIIKTANEVLAFLLELALFAIICYWGYGLGKSTFSKYVFAVLLVLIAIVLWGIFAAPNSEYRLAFPLRLLFELGMFFTGTYILYGLKHASLALCFGVLSFMSVLIAFIYRQ